MHEQRKRPPEGDKQKITAGKERGPVEQSLYFYKMLIFCFIIIHYFFKDLLYF